MTEQERVPVTRVSLEHRRTGQHAACATLAEANATLTRWSWPDAGARDSDGRDTPGGNDGDDDAASCVVYWADGTRLVVRYDLPCDAGGAHADLGAAIRAQCAYSAGRRQPPEMPLEDYQRLVYGAGRKTIERYERMLDTLEM